MIQQEEQPIDIVPPEKIAFIAYNIGVYESVQKFGSLITSGKITDNESDVQKIAQLLSEASAFYDAEMIAQIINAILRSNHHQRTINNNKPTIDSVTPSEVKYVMRQLKTTGFPIP
jgi:Trp operon repressor